MENANPILAKGAAVKRPRRRDPLREVERSWGLAALADDASAGADDSDELEDEPINAAEIFGAFAAQAMLCGLGLLFKCKLERENTVYTRRKDQP